MALRINLYHEALKQQQARRRDPLKLGMFGLAFIGVCFVLYYICRLSTVHDLNNRVAVLQQEWAKCEPREKAAKAREDELEKKKKLTDALVARIETRFYWAPVLDEILESVPREIQLTRLDGGLVKDHEGEVTLMVNGISGSAAPRQAAEELRTTIDEKFGAKFKKVASHFNLLDDSDVSVTLDGQTRATANFAIEFQLHTQPETVPAATQVRHKIAAQ